MDFSSNAEMALRLVREAQTLVYDTETSGVDWKRNHPVGYVFGDCASEKVWVPVRCGGGGNLLGWQPLTSSTEGYVQHPFEVELAKAFAERSLDVSKVTVGHNIKFDAHFSANAGIMLGRNLVCTQNAEALLDEFSRSFSLDACCKAHRVTAKKGDDLYNHISKLFNVPADRKSMEHFWRLAGNDPISVDYAVGDIISTGELYKSQMAHIADQRLDYIFNLESKLVWTVFRMERKGIRVNEEYAAKMIASVGESVKEALDSLPDGFNPRSPNAVKALCVDAGFVNWPTTEKGNPSFTEDFLSTFEAGRKVVNLRQMTNLLNTFAKPLVEEHIFKGRVHANLNQMKGDDFGTISGRFSCNAPNLQQIPSRNPFMSKTIREMFESDPGYIFVEVDVKAQEPRAFAHYSEDENLMAGYFAVPSVDVHTTASKLLDLDRDSAKRLNMGIFTGMQPKTLSEHLGTELYEARKLFNKWFAAFPKVRIFQDTAKDIFSKRGYVRTILGRRCRLENHRFAYQGTSRIIQGFGADTIKYMLLRLDIECERTGLADLLMTVHDSIVWQFIDTPEGHEFSLHLAKLMCDVQTPPINLKVPFEVEYHEGLNWALAKHGKKRVVNLQGFVQ